MYDKTMIKLIIENVETSNKFKVGVKQGDSMVPVLFIFLIMDFYETLEDEWMTLRLIKSQFVRKNNSSRSIRQLVSQQPGTFLSGILFDPFCTLFVENVAFVFESRTDLKKGITLLSDQFPQFEF